MQQEAVLQLMSSLPEQVGTFSGSEFPLPVHTTFLGSRSPDLNALRRDLLQRQDGDVKDLMQPVLLGAELCEAASPDREQFFLKDIEVQNLVFMGSKWRAGWALVLGSRNHPDIVRQLQDREFMVFSDEPNVEGTTWIGSRPTSPVYFLQLMVRYGLVWGRIAEGNDHEMGHFLERDMPGFIIITEDLPPLKYLVALGLMKLGAPAVVPTTYPFPYGNRIVGDSAEDMVAKACSFSNLRVRFLPDEVIRLPELCNPAYAKEPVVPARVYGGTAESFFCMWFADGPVAPLKVTGTPDQGIGILVEVNHAEFTPDISATMEHDALEAVNFIQGVRATLDNGVLSVALAEGRALDAELIGRVIISGIRLKYPRVMNIGVEVIFDADRLRRVAPASREYQKQRRDLVKGMTEGNTDLFCSCTECRPFSLVHTCLLVPDRLPMCGSRTYHTVKAAALFGSTVLPFQRRAEESVPLRMVFNKGRVIDPVRGEYEGCNAAYARLTEGKLTRVFLHSLREAPHTSCGCFQNLAFWMEAIQGIGILSRNSEAVTPEDKTWAELANRAGGKQSPGILGVSTAYIRSLNFLKGDGGLSNVVWVDSKLYTKIADVLPPGAQVATEKDVSDLRSLQAFLHR